MERSFSQKVTGKVHAMHKRVENYLGHNIFLVPVATSVYMVTWVAAHSVVVSSSGSAAPMATAGYHS